MEELEATRPIIVLWPRTRLLLPLPMSNASGAGRTKTMFATLPTPEVDLSTGLTIQLPEPKPRLSPREQHAHMLVVAAARRLRAQERMGVQRHTDADYWKSVAPSAVNKARGLREHPSFQRLPD